MIVRYLQQQKKNELKKYTHISQSDIPAEVGFGRDLCRYLAWFSWIY